MRPAPAEPSPTVLGIAGGSGSGKSTVVRRIVRALGAERVAVIPHDAYYRDLSHLPAEARARFNFDHPDSLETELLRDHLARLLSGHPVEIPSYDFARHARRAQTRVVRPTALVILDGILVLADARLRAQLDYAVYVHATAEERLARRIRRDTTERGRTRESVVRQFHATVGPMHERFVEPTRAHADLTIEGGGHNDRAIERLVAALEELSRIRVGTVPARSGLPTG